MLATRNIIELNTNWTSTEKFGRSSGSVRNKFDYLSLSFAPFQGYDFTFDGEHGDSFRHVDVVPNAQAVTILCYEHVTLRYPLDTRKNTF